MGSRAAEIRRLTEEFREREWRTGAEAAIDKLALTRSEAQLEIYTMKAGWSEDEYLADFRRRTRSAAITDLTELGISHPRLALARAIDEVHAWEGRLSVQIVDHLKLVILYSAAMAVHERRDGGQYDWPTDDLLEAQLETGIEEAAVRARIAESERRARSAARVPA